MSALSDPREYDEAEPHAPPEHQQAAAASPHTSLTEMVGNFADLERLFDSLGEPNVMELGKPLPDEKVLPKKRIGSCPAAHNEALVGKR